MAFWLSFKFVDFLLKNESYLVDPSDEWNLQLRLLEMAEVVGDAIDILSHKLNLTVKFENLRMLRNFPISEPLFLKICPQFFDLRLNIRDLFQKECLFLIEDLDKLKGSKH